MPAGRWVLLVLLSLGTVSLDVGYCQTDADAGNETGVEKKTFKEAEKEITTFVNDQLRAILPKVVGGAGSTNLGPRCQASMMKVLASVRQLKGWTLKFLDSMGKPASGIMKGTSYSLGQYDQCTNLAVTKKGVETSNFSEAMFQGMYCKVKIRFEDVVVERGRDYHRGEINATELGKLKEIIQSSPFLPMTSEFMNHYLGICVPSTCTTEDVQELLKMISFPGIVSLERCETKDTKDMDIPQMIVMATFYFLVTLVLLSSLIHWICKDKLDDSLTESRDRGCVSVTISISICNSTRQLMKNINDDTDSVLSGNSVRGIVVASTVWIILGTTYMLPYDAYYLQASSVDNLQDYLQDGFFVFVASFPLAVDALFVCYGFILTYTLWFSASRADDVKVSVIKLIVCNYLRFVIPVLISLGIGIILPAIGSGPFWNDFMNEVQTNCSENAGAHVGMFSNFLGYHQQCFPHLWFPSCLAQLTFIGIILSWILSRYMKFGVMLVILLALAGNITLGIYTFSNNLPPAYMPYFLDNTSDMFFNVNYSLPLSHFGPYGVGLLSGIFVARRSTHKLRPVLTVIGWLFCLAVTCSLFLFVYKFYMHPMDSSLSAFYAGSHRTLFGLCVAWVIVACSFGNGGSVHSILSWRVFDPLFRLSYYAYIFHFIVILYSAAVAKEHFHYSHYNLMLRTISYTALTFFISYLFYILFEGPFKNLCNTLCPKRVEKIDVTPLNYASSFKGDIFTANNVISGSCKLWSVSSNKLPTQ